MNEHADFLRNEAIFECEIDTEAAYRGWKSKILAAAHEIDRLTAMMNIMQVDGKYELQEAIELCEKAINGQGVLVSDLLEAVKILLNEISNRQNEVI